MLFELHVASVAAMFAFVRRLSASPLAALCAAAAFGCAYYRYHNIVFVGKLVMAPTFLLWPLQLLLVEHVLAAQPSRRAGAALGLVTASALAAHVYFGFYASIFAALYGLVRAPTLHSSLARAARAIMRQAGWMALGVLGALFYTLPAALEIDLTTQGGWYPGGYVQRVAGWPVREIFAAVFTWEGGQSRWWQWGYVGNSILLLAVAGGLAAAGTEEQLRDAVSHLVLPTLTQTIIYLAEYLLIMRSTMLDVLAEDYILTAKAKGLSTFQVLKDHALRNAALPIITIVALNLGFTVAGAVQIEAVFSWPGLGQAIYESVARRDYPVLQGAFLLLAISVIVANLLADLLYTWLDPRVQAPA